MTLTSTDAQQLLHRGPGRWVSRACGALLLLGLAPAAAGELEVLSAEDRKTLREYKDGPLTAADFAAPPPESRVSNGVLLRSSVFTDVRYRYEYRGKSVPGGFEAALSRIRFIAAVDRSKSWNVAPRDAELLDHEQGHFDITALAAARAQARFDKLLRGEGLAARGPDERAAVAALDRKIAEAFAALHQGWREEQLAYDKATLHGTHAEKQAELRRQQKEQLQLLAREAEERAREAK